tara:strand:- start:433 stop:774 length:342 start_codon:yes stop_codon:yes gene_type:complete
MKNFQQFKEEVNKITKNPNIDPITGIEKKDYAGNVKTGPDIHGLSKKYPNNVMDLPNDNQTKIDYFQEPSTIKYFKANPTIKMQFYGEKNPRTYTNPYNKSALNSPKGVFPKG